ncbi:hypothetical protein EDF88_3980 [Buttiauxella sp. BIGb0552]|nr:hypothetical protein EDF88_3980 [Buttiauxella sp. BIGb0552]
MHRLRAVVGNEDIAVAEVLSPPPVNNLTLKARHEVLTRFVVRRVVQFNAENVPVIENDQAPAVERLKRAGSVTPGHANHPFEKFSFKHFVAPGTLQCCKVDQYWR